MKMLKNWNAADTVILCGAIVNAVVIVLILIYFVF